MTKARELAIEIVSKDPSFIAAVWSALDRLQASAGGSFVLEAALETRGAAPVSDLCLEMARRGGRFLSGFGVRFVARGCVSPGLGEALPGPNADGLLILDGALSPERSAAELSRWAATDASRRGTRLESVVLAVGVLRLESTQGALRMYSTSSGRVLAVSSLEGIGECALSALLDQLQRLLTGFHDTADRPPVALARGLHQFLHERYLSDWGFHYLTGSPIAAFIGDLEGLCRRDGVPALRGPNEHALACGAFANWRLYQRPYVLALTKGMIDELKGTLSNLRGSRSKGFIVVAEDVAEAWFGTQAGITPDEDVRKTLSARDVHYVYLRDCHELRANLAEAFRLFDLDQGPVVLLAASDVLQHRTPEVALAPPPAPHSAGARGAAAAPAELLERALHLVNREPVHLCWQVGSVLSRRATALLLDIAARAGIGLANTCVSPGAVPHFRDGAPTPNMLGTTGLYSFNRQVHDFLFAGGRPRPDQVLGYLASRISGMERPFSDKVAQSFRMLQVNRNPRHLAPFVELGLAMEVDAFLEWLAPRIEVDSAVKELREARLAAAMRPPLDLVEEHATRPMTAPHFMVRLGRLVERLIRARRYDFTSVNGASRVGFSMVRNVPTVRPGLSGLYGRGLMGDAVMALGSLAFTARTSVLAVVGDGERNLVPDLWPGLIENLLSGKLPIKHNVTLFVGCNNSYSMIETYLNFSGAARAGGNRQVTNINMFGPDGDFEVAGVHFCQRVLDDFDEAFLEEALLQPRRVNLFPVMLAHNNAGDGMTLASMSDWRYSEG